MAQGISVVATDVGGTRDAVLHGTTGLLVPPSNPSRLAEAMDALLGDRTRRQAIGLAAQRYVRDRFGAARVIASLEALYTALVSTT